MKLPISILLYGLPPESKDSHSLLLLTHLMIFDFINHFKTCFRLDFNWILGRHSNLFQYMKAVEYSEVNLHN